MNGITLHTDRQPMVASSTAGCDYRHTMSSREIAKLTGKEHKHVMADIRNMCEQLGIDSAEFSAQYKDATGRTLPCFNLDRYHTEILVTGYDVKRRAAVIKRWHDLESGKAQPFTSQQPSIPELIQAADLMASALRLEGSARLSAMRSFTAANCPQLLPMMPDYAIDAPMVTGGTESSLPTESASALLKQHKAGMAAAKFNKLCATEGLLEQKSRINSKGKTVHFWSVTDAGLAYGKNVTSPQSPLQTQPHWYSKHFAELLKLVSKEEAA